MPFVDNFQEDSLVWLLFETEDVISTLYGELNKEFCPYVFAVINNTNMLRKFRYSLISSSWEIC